MKYIPELNADLLQLQYWEPFASRHVTNMQFILSHTDLAHRHISYSQRHGRFVAAHLNVNDRVASLVFFEALALTILVLGYWLSNPRGRLVPQQAAAAAL